MMNEIIVHRVYDHQAVDASYRILVDRLWPRGVKKEDLHLDEWNKELPPSPELRKWFDHEPARFDEFSALYREELMGKQAELNRVRSIAKHESVVLLYGAKDPKINHAVVLRDVLTELK